MSVLPVTNRKFNTKFLFLIGGYLLLVVSDLLILFLLFALPVLYIKTFHLHSLIILGVRVFFGAVAFGAALVVRTLVIAKIAGIRTKASQAHGQKVLFRYFFLIMIISLLAVVLSFNLATALFSRFHLDVNSGYPKTIPNLNSVNKIVIAPGSCNSQNVNIIKSKTITDPATVRQWSSYAQSNGDDWQDMVEGISCTQVVLTYYSNNTSLYTLEMTGNLLRSMGDTSYKNISDQDRASIINLAK